jgi:hypothetical protein
MLHCEEFWNLHFSSKVATLAKQRIIGQVGHEAHIGATGMRKKHTISVKNSEGKNHLGDIGIVVSVILLKCSQRNSG